MSIFHQRQQRVGGMLGARTSFAREMAAKADVEPSRGLDGFGFGAARKCEQVKEQPMQARTEPQATEPTTTEAPDNPTMPASSGQEPGPASTRVAGDGKVPSASTSTGTTAVPEADGAAAMPKPGEQAKKNDLFPTATPTAAQKGASKYGNVLGLARTHVRANRVA